MALILDGECPHCGQTWKEQYLDIQVDGLVHMEGQRFRCAWCGEWVVRHVQGSGEQTTMVFVKREVAA